MSKAKVMPRPEKYVVIATRSPFNCGSLVVCGATLKESAELVMKELSEHPNMKEFGPFSLMTSKEAEKKKMYGAD